MSDIDDDDRELTETPESKEDNSESAGVRPPPEQDTHSDSFDSSGVRPPPEGKADTDGGGSSGVRPPSEDDTHSDSVEAPGVRPPEENAGADASDTSVVHPPADAGSQDITHDPYYMEPLGPNDLEANRWNTELQAIRDHPGGSRQALAETMGWNGPENQSDGDLEQQHATDQAQMSDTAGVRPPSDDDRQERAAVQRVAPFLTDKPEDYLQSLDAPGDRRHLQFSADNCEIIADALDRHANRLEHIGVTEQPRSQFYGDFGEIASQMPYEGFGEVNNLNDPNKMHDNHFGADFEVKDDDGQLRFQGDSKVSTQEYPNSMFRKALQEDDVHIEQGRLQPEAAHLFVPHDQMLSFKDYIEKNYPEEAERWLPRIHESGMPKEYYRTIADECSDKDGNVQVSAMRDLAKDLRVASDYLRRRSR